MTRRPRASALIRGTVMHARRDHHAHRTFRYPVYIAALDLAELPALHRELRLFSHGGTNLFAFHDRDYAGGTPSVAAGLADLLAGNGLPAPHTTRLVTNLRVAGYVFNPASFFLNYDATGALTSVVAEVNNTYGGRRRYLLGPDQRIAPRPATGASSSLRPNDTDPSNTALHVADHARTTIASSNSASADAASADSARSGSARSDSARSDSASSSIASSGIASSNSTSSNSTSSNSTSSNSTSSNSTSSGAASSSRPNDTDPANAADHARTATRASSNAASASSGIASSGIATDTRVGFRHVRELFVSPFLHGPATYDFWFDAPLDGDRLAITMHVDRPDGERVFVARLAGTCQPLTDRALLAAAVRYPLMTAQVIGLIHLEAAKLRLRGVLYLRPGADHRPRPEPPRVRSPDRPTPPGR